MKEKETIIDDLRINYKVAGDGPTILILHGWGGSSDSWKMVIDILSREFKIISPDLPGFGKSQVPFQSWDLINYVFWLKNFVEKLNIENFSLIGHSFGGRIAIKFSIFWPEKVKNLILCNPAGIKSGLNFKEKLIFLISQFGKILFQISIFKKNKEKAKNFFYKILKNKDYVKTKNPIMKETMRKIIAEDLLPIISMIKTKTLIIWGAKDKIIPLKKAYIFREKIKKSKLEILPANGHSPHLENPEDLSKIIINFLRY